MTRCPSCKTDNAPSAKFCNECGTRLESKAATPEVKNYTPRHLAEKILRSRGAMEGERKRVTVLFCDIKGSTRLAQEAGAEQWHHILDRFFAILSAAVHRYEGTVNQYTGDGIMALFGAPIAHEDHAQRACFTALEMQREVRRFADELRLQKSLNLSLRVGLNTGEVIVGRIGDDLRMDYTAQGPTVNLAARMEHICEPGRIYLTRNTAKLAEGYFRLRNLGRMNVSGLDEAVEVHELEAEGALRTRLDRSIARGASLFVGRENELGLLTSAIERVRNGEGQVVAVVGNAGIGKSRLCHEFTNACADSGIAVHRSTGVPYGHAVPLHPVRTLTQSRLGLPEQATADEVRKFVAGTLLMHDPSLVGILPVVFDFLGAAESGATPLAPEQAAIAREKMFELLADFLPCEKEPQILLVEDLHFLDAASEEFLATLCQRIKSCKTLLLVNYRPDYVSEWLIPFLDEQIAVSALKAEQLENLASCWLGSHASLKGVATRIRERANGNPFFVEEAVLALHEAGYLEGERGQYQLKKTIEHWPVPDTVHALLSARMDRLEDSHKQLLQTAAIIGQEFSSDWLHPLVEDEVDEGLSVLEDAGFVHQRRSGGEMAYAFCHPLMQEVAYGAQLESRRAESHARLATVLEGQYEKSKSDSLLARIAHHWSASGNRLKAGHWSLEAARIAAGRDMLETLRHFRLARTHFDAAPFSDEMRKGRIAARAGIIRMAQFASVETAEVEQCYAEARQLADECGDIPCAAELLLSYGAEHLHRGKAQTAAELTARAVNLCVQKGYQQLVHRFRLSVLMSHNAAGLPREGIALTDSADGGQWRLDAVSQDNFQSRAFYGLMLAWLGQLKPAYDNLRQALDHSERERRAASWINSYMVDYAWFSGEYELALPHARESIKAAESSASPFFIALAHRSLGRALNLNGQFQEAIQLMEPLRTVTASGGYAHQFEANYLAVMADSYLGLGDFEKAHALAEAGIASAQQSGSHVWEIAAWLPLMELPVQGPWAVRRDEGFVRCEHLVEQSGAEGFRPRLQLLQAAACADAQQKKRLLDSAQNLLTQQGALALIRRLKASSIF